MHVGRRTQLVVGFVGLLSIVSAPHDVTAQERSGPMLQSASCRVPGAENRLEPRRAVRVGWGAGQASERWAQQPRRVIAQVTRSERADATFEVRPGAEGTIQLVGRRGALEFTKTVLPDGSFTLDLAAGKDRVTLAVSAQTTVITRGKSKVTLPGDVDTDTDDRARASRRLLADSSAVLQFRALATRLLLGDEWSAAAVAVIAADATVGALTGDLGAPGRAAQHLSRKGRARVRPAAFAIDCFYLMESRFVQAWDDYVSCYYSVQDNPIYANLCAWRWTLQVESYWFSFISCSGFSGWQGA